MAVSQDLIFTITVNTTRLNIGTLERDVVKVYASCYMQRLENHQTCRNGSGLYTMMGLHDCASAALGSYPVMINTTDENPWLTSTDAVAVIVENDAKMCNYSDAIFEHGAFQTRSSWSDTPLVAFFAVRNVNQAEAVPFEAAVLVEACNGSLWAVVAPSKNVSNSIGDIPILPMQHTVNRSCSPYQFVGNLVEQIAWNMGKGRSCSEPSTIFYVVPLCHANDTSEQTIVSVQFGLKPANWTTVPISSLGVNATATCTGPTTTSMVSNTHSTTTASTTFSTPTVTKTGTTTASSPMSSMGTTTTTSTVQSTVTSTPITSTSSVPTTSTATTLASTTTPTTTVTTEPSSSTGTKTASIATTTTASSAKPTMGTYSSTTRESTSAVSSTVSSTTPLKPSTETESSSTMGLSSTSTTSTGSNSTSTTANPATSAVTTEFKASITPAGPMTVEMSSTDVQSASTANPSTSATEPLSSSNIAETTTETPELTTSLSSEATSTAEPSTVSISLSTIIPGSSGARTASTATLTTASTARVTPKDSEGFTSTQSMTSTMSSSRFSTTATPKVTENSMIPTTNTMSTKETMLSTTSEAEIAASSKATTENSAAQSSTTAEHTFAATSPSTTKQVSTALLTAVSSTMETTMPTDTRSSPTTTEDREDTKSTVHSVATSDTTTTIGTSATFEQSDDTSVHGVSSTIRTTTEVSASATEQAAHTTTLASKEEEPISTVPGIASTGTTEMPTDVDSPEPAETTEKDTVLTSTATVSIETSTQSIELLSSQSSSSSESGSHTMTEEATLPSTTELTSLEPGHLSTTYSVTSMLEISTSSSTSDEMPSSTLSAATTTDDQSKASVPATDQASVTTSEALKTMTESSTLASTEPGTSSDKSDASSRMMKSTAIMPITTQTAEAGSTTSESITPTSTMEQTEATTSEAVSQATEQPAQSASTDRAFFPAMSPSEAPTSTESSSTSARVTERSVSVSSSVLSQSVGTSSQSPHVQSDSLPPHEDANPTSSTDKVTTAPESSARTSTETKSSTTTSEDMLLSLRTTSSVGSVPTSTVMLETLTADDVTTAKRPQQTTTPKSCEQECEDGWAPGKGTDCYEFIDASTSPTAANWTYLDFDQACTAIGQSQVYMKDFNNDDLYELFASLSSQSASKNKLVYAQTLPTPEYRQQRTVQYVDLSVNVYLRREVGTVANDAILPNISAICRKPKFCADDTCKIADYFDKDVPQTQYLKTMKNVTSIPPGETIMVGCATNSGQFKLTCNQRGYLQPHPSTLDCLSKNETSSPTDSALPNIRVKNCTQCFKMGTENCTQGDGFAVCECKPGWRSSICLFTEDFCSADPCLNGGTCENDVDDYLCHCRVGYKGRRCEIDTTSATDPAANAVYKQVTTKDTLLAVWTTVCAIYIKIRAADRRQGNTPQETLQQSREIITGVALALNAWFRNPTRCLFGKHTDELGCRMFYWAINSLFLTCMCLMYHEAENMYGVLRGRWHNVWAPGNIDFAVRIFGSIAVGFGTTAAITFYYWDELPQPASCIGGFHDSAQSATVLYFGIGTVIALLTCWRVSQSYFAWQSDYLESVRYHKAINEDLGRLWVIFPRNYAMVTQPVENNVFALGPTLILYWLSWGMTVYANDAFSTKIVMVSSVVSFLYALANTVQTYVTDPEDFQSVVQFLMIRAPCMWMPAYDYYSMKTWSEVAAEKKPELLEQTVKDVEKAKEDYRKKEHDWIDRVNDAIRTTYAAVHRVRRKRVPKKLLLHKPEQGPERIDRNKALRAQFAWMNPSDPSYIPVHLRKWWYDWWTKDYLQQRRRLPRRENFPWEAAKNVHREHWCAIHSFGPGDTEMCQLFYLWAVQTVKSDNYKTDDPDFREVMEQGLKALTVTDVNPQLEVTENFGPAPAPLVKEKQIRKAIEKDRERDAEENAEWDQVYEDDPEPGLKEPAQFERSAVTGEKINTNPRKKPLTDEHMLAMESKAGFIGPRLRNKQLPPGVPPSTTKRMEIQQQRDKEWEETKEADRLQQVSELWRRKTLPWMRQLLGIPYTSDEEARLNLPNELRSDHPGPSRAEEEEDEKQRKQQEFARTLQEEMKKEK